MKLGNLWDGVKNAAPFGTQDLSLTQREMALLSFLMARPDNVYSRVQISDAVYGPTIHVSDRTVDSHLRNLRAKLAEIGATDAIETVHGVGVRMGSCLGA